MTRISDETRRKVVRAHIQGGRTIASLVAEYGISRATVSNRVRSYREECQNNDGKKSPLEMMEDVVSGVRKPNWKRRTASKENTA